MSKNIHFEMLSELVELKCVLIFCIYFYYQFYIYFNSIYISYKIIYKYLDKLTMKKSVV